MRRGSAPNAGCPTPQCCRRRRSQPRAELLLLAVPDAELAGLVSGLAATAAVRPGTIVAHTSGANGIGVLAPLTEQGCIPLAIHPAMTFTGSDEDIAGCPTPASASPRPTRSDTRSRSRWCSRSAANRSASARTPARCTTPRWRMPSNHIVTVLADAVEALRAALRGRSCSARNSSATQPGGIAERVIGPLARASLENALQRGQAALTGPVARGDAAAVAGHLRALTEVDPATGAGISGELVAHRPAGARPQGSLRGARADDGQP